MDNHQAIRSAFNIGELSWVQKPAWLSPHFTTGIGWINRRRWHDSPHAVEPLPPTRGWAADYFRSYTETREETAWRIPSEDHVSACVWLTEAESCLKFQISILEFLNLEIIDLSLIY